jgi:phthalate 4,5-cis-dihydrodiol dehydrogenase
MVGVGIIGAGRICGAHALSANAVPETRLAAIADVDADRAAQAAAAWGGAAYGDYRELLADSDVDLAVIALPHHLHLEVTLAALAAGKHVLLEKPMALNTAECDAMIAAEQAAGKRLMVAHSQHYFAVNREARRLLTAGLIGRVVLATDTWYKPFWEGKRPDWFLQSQTGGGMWPMNGSHMIDRLLQFVGSRVVRVSAQVGNPVFGLSATDTGVAFLQFENGTAATIMHCGYREGGPPRLEAELTGTEGQLRLTGDRGEANELRHGHGGTWESLPVPPLELTLRPGVEPPNPVFAAQLQDFARCVLEGRDAPISSAYGREVVRIMQACEEAAPA